MSKPIYHSARKIYHTLTWVKRLFHNCCTAKKHFGRTYANLCFLNDISIHFDSRNKEKHISRKNHYIKTYLKKQLVEVLNTYANSPSVSNCAEDEKKIWLFWWDGIDSAPDIVKACINSVIIAASSIPVVLLDKNNIYDYITIPNDIQQKHSEGVIGHAHFSDILRLSLLAKYGGQWIDATVFFSKPVPDKMIRAPFFTCKMDVYDPLVPSHYLWAGWILGGNKQFPLFTFARDALIQYWRLHDHLIDYLLMDYIFDLAYEEIPEVHQAINELECNNPDRHELMKHLNDPYFSKFFDRDTYFYKLSYRYGAPKVSTSTGMTTFYGHIINEMLKEASWHDI